MKLEFLGVENFQKIMKDQIPIVDVRAPKEFAEGHLPGSVNLPLMNDEERHLVGIEYKKSGREAAIELGLKLVSGEVKSQRVKAWMDYLQQNPEAIITCFRGGLRSKFSQQWCAEAGYPRPRIEGGYKAVRTFLIETISKFTYEKEMTLIGGCTGAAKSLLLRDLVSFRDCLDLERQANHRGSAFGGYGNGQPAQATFENLLARDILLLSQGGRVIIEDESRLIGKCVQPEIFFEKLRNSPLVFVDEPLSQRVENTYQDYIVNSTINSDDVDQAQTVFDRYLKSLSNIQKRLGGLRYQECLRDLQKSRQDYQEHREILSNKIWIEKLLHWYYDPLYNGSLEMRKPKILFRGTRAQVFDYLKSKLDQ
ncbi:MAG: tRNA 2-selenouridine synthase [Oligoflexia bacterium]|nr:MAG: tRNA 2-selenouridine synthase [Oligoflexia bacterium]